MSFEKRLQLIMASNRLNASSFADRIGVQRSNVSHILNGRNKPGYDFLLKVVQAFPNVNTHWLLTGEENTDPIVNEVQEPGMSYNSSSIKKAFSQESKELSVVNAPKTSEKKIIKTVIFYDDFTFDAFLPNT